MSKSEARSESFIDRLHPLKPKMKEVLIDLLKEDGREESGRALMPEERKKVREYLGELVLMLVKVDREKSTLRLEETNTQMDNTSLSRS